MTTTPQLEKNAGPASRPPSPHGGDYAIRGINAPRSRYFAQGRFGRMFANLPPLGGFDDALRKAMEAIGAVQGPMDAGQNNPDNEDIPAGFTFLGQFIDHDITFDPTSSLEQQSDPEAIQNFRTPVLELDSVYGAGPGASPHLYDRKQANKLLLDTDALHDLPRNSQGTALIGDPRNDENVIVSQLQLAVIRFHNKVVDRLTNEGVTPANGIFQEAQRLVRWHYQWVIVHEFLPHICGDDVLSDITTQGRCFYDWRNEPFIPVEFAVAAYRFGHTQVRPGYEVNGNFRAAIFGDATNDLRGGKRLPIDREVDWSKFFEMGGPAPQRSKRLDTKLSTPLLQLPFIPEGQQKSLAARNLLRHLTFSLPSGQAVAQFMTLGKSWKKVSLNEVAPLGPEHFSDLANIPAGGVRLDLETPLWFYVLREAEERGQGKHLGPVGARIVGEVLLGLLDGDRFSFTRADPNWQPMFGATPGKFAMRDLIAFAAPTA